MRVRVPFGRSTLTGYIVAVTPHADIGGKPARIREVLARVDEKPIVPTDLLALAEWVSERYLAPLGQCLRLAFHGSPDRTSSTPRTKQPDAVPPVIGIPTSEQPTFNVQRLTFNEALAPLRAKVLDALAHHRPERIGRRGSASSRVTRPSWWARGQPSLPPSPIWASSSSTRKTIPPTRRKTYLGTMRGPWPMNAQGAPGPCSCWPPLILPWKSCTQSARRSWRPARPPTGCHK